MSIPDFFKNAQSSARSGVPLAFTYLEVGGYGDSAAPGVYTPFLQDVDGNLFVTLGGAGGGTILLPDNADGVAEVATASRVPTVARNYVYDPFLEQYNRWRGESDNFDAVSPSGTFNAGVVETRPRLYNSSDDFFYRARSNDNLTVLASAARTATNSSATFKNTNWRGAQIVIDVTAITATPSVVFSVEGFDALSGMFYSLLDSVAIVAVGTTVITVYPGLTALANIVASDLLPWQWRVTATHADADSITYSVAANVML